ncbi:MAG TPA: alpha/beta fold hydrolase [Verrucomicrobiae bacterium]|nr:alpha/beta fold hydrolase [Verrucomicrobiae bacterium]
MIAPLARFLDWSAIQAVTLMMPAQSGNPRLEKAIEFLKSPDFIPADSQPAQVEFNGLLDFHFPTPRPCEFTENNVVHGRLYRCGERWQERPVIILLHGSGDPLNYKFRFPLIAQRCNRAGFNAALLVAPYHFERRPRRVGGSLFYSDMLQFAEATAQAIAEIRALTGWLFAEGCPTVALWGYSLGAWYAAMTACRDSRLSAVVLGSPCARMNPWVEQRAVRPRIRARLQRVREICHALNGTALNLTSTLPAIPKDAVLLVEAAHDVAICPKSDTEDLWRSWGQPDIWRLPHGHVGVCCGLVPGLPDRVLRWLAPRLEATTTVAKTTRCGVSK